MIPPELVRARRRAGALELLPLKGPARDAALELASELLDTARSLVGHPRSELEGALESAAGELQDRKLAEGLVKLTVDACELASVPELDPVVVRRALFERMASGRRGEGDAPTREAVIAEVATELSTSPDAIERAMFSDLRGAQEVLRGPLLDAEALLVALDRAQLQAVLLRAVGLVVDVRCGSPAAYRALFRALKFRRLLHKVEPRADGGFRISIDGPMSLFEASTRYGLQLSLLLPALEGCDSFVLVAELRWGKERISLTFQHVHERARDVEADAPEEPEELTALVASLQKLETQWRVAPADVVLELPGHGVCIPDLVLTKPGRKQTVYLELLGYWSRDAVWKRVELVQAGLGEPVLFCVSSRLRVSEEVLGDEDAAALYVFKGVMSARSVLERVEKLAGRRARKPRS